MLTYPLFFALCLLISLNSQPQPIQTPDAIQVSGVCFDATNAVYLPVEAFAISGTTKVKLGQSDKDGKFNFLLPFSATSISFTHNDYRTVTLPVTFVNKPNNRAEFRLGIIMGKRDSLAVQQTHQLKMSNTLPDSIDVTYLIEPTGSNARRTIVTTAHGNRVPAGGRITVKKGRRLPLLTFDGAQPGPYRITASTANGQVLVSEEFTVEEGLTFMEIRANKPNQPTLSNSVNVLPNSRTVYFEQTRHELNSATKMTLDSVARLLTAQPQMVAHITGYTDNVGEQKLNLTLSEYRAKGVANYLKQRGVQEAQLLIDWKGGNALAATGDSEDAKTRNRRVVIQFNHK